jgi:hypothetical protein
MFTKKISHRGSKITEEHRGNNKIPSLSSVFLSERLSSIFFPKIQSVLHPRAIIRVYGVILTVSKSH